ncbi:unnamed protein product [Meganyctiphanes norvegica]|uniref:Uncharacterized protein n=1 Tax=Meganyctiphanes norvegica TaxID=48144 RepID=A0AAV2RJL3_MEGNR
MYIVTFAILLFGVSTSLASERILSCINPFTLVGSQCLFFGGEWAMDHEKSKDICITIGGYLARINSTTQHKAIVDHITESSELDHSYWVDGSDVANTNIWLFANGKLVPRGTPFWRTEQMIDDDNNTYIQRPLDGGWLNCLSLQKSFHYFFSDEECQLELSPLCEKDPDVGVPHNKHGTENHVSSITTSSKLDTSRLSCGKDHVGLDGIITSPLYPLGAPDSLDCHHTITISPDQVTPQSYIALTFTDITGDCGELDFVEVRDGLDSSSPLLATYNPTTCCAPVNSTGPHMFLLIHTSSSDVDTSCGTRFDWKAENTKCGEDITGIEGTLTSPRYNGHYFNNLKCQWTITSTPELSTPDTHIIISIAHFDMQVGRDYLLIRDGASSDAPLLANLSGHDVGEPNIHSSGQHLHFYFHTDGSNTYEGFTIEWRAEICPTPYMIIGGMCLKFIWSDLSWGEASVTCQSEGGQLAAVKEPQQLRDIYLYLHDEGIEEDSFWLGGSDDSFENFWTWADGSLVTQGTPFWGLSGYRVVTEEEEKKSDNAASRLWNELFGLVKGDSSSSLYDIQEPDGGKDENCLALLAEGFHFFRDAPCSWHLKAICSHPLN